MPALRPLPCSAAEVSAETLQEMNPLVKVTAKRGAAETASAEAVKGYQVQAHACTFQPNLNRKEAIGQILERTHWQGVQQ